MTQNKFILSPLLLALVHHTGMLTAAALYLGFPGAPVLPKLQRQRLKVSLFRLAT